MHSAIVLVTGMFLAGPVNSFKEDRKAQDCLRTDCHHAETVRGDSRFRDAATESLLP